MADREEIAKLRHQLETKQTIIKKQTMEIDIVTNRRGIYNSYIYGKHWICTIT